MSWMFLILGAAVIVLLEYYWAPYSLRSVRFRGSCSKELAQPGEIVTWSGTVENVSRLPIPFVRLMEKFPFQAKLHGDPRWIQNHYHQSMTQWYVEEKMAMLPLRSKTKTIQFSLPERGCYSIGNYQLATGDLLGFREISKTGQWQQIVIMPERSRNSSALDAFGGFLGDISVRRFIMEDPILTVGFRDYTGREPMKSISWNRTASAGSIQVRQYDHTAEQHVMILLNVEGGSGEELEECFRLVRSVCEVLEQKKIPYGFCTNGNLPGPMGKLFWLAEGLGQRHMNTILYGLGRADYTCYSSLHYLTERTLRQRKSNESYIVVTPELTEKSRSAIRKLNAAVGSGVFVLEGKGETEKK